MNRPLASGSKRSLAAVLVIAAILLAACTTGSAASPSPVGGPAATPAVEAPSATPSANPSPTPAPSVKPAPSPTPVPAAWGKAKQVYKGDCGWLHGGIDAAGGEHAVAWCIGGLLYASSKPNGSWTSQKFTTPENRIEQDPQIAFQGNVAYFAYTRLAIEEGGCGDDGLRDIGVFYRTRTLPSGAWSNPIKVGRSDDELRGFRVDGSTLHAIVQTNGQGRYSYLLVKGGTTTRYSLPGVDGGTSLRIGSNGRAQIAYESNRTIKLATFTGSGFAVETVPGADARDPVLVL